MNWNTLLISVGLALGGATLKEVMSTHDDMIKVKMEQASQAKDMTDVRVRLAAVEVEIQKLKERIK